MRFSIFTVCCAQAQLCGHMPEYVGIYRGVSNIGISLFVGVKCLVDTNASLSPVEHISVKYVLNYLENFLTLTAKVGRRMAHPLSFIHHGY